MRTITVVIHVENDEDAEHIASKLESVAYDYVSVVNVDTAIDITKDDERKAIYKLIDQP